MKTEKGWKMQKSNWKTNKKSQGKSKKNQVKLPRIHELFFRKEYLCISCILTKNHEKIYKPDFVSRKVGMPVIYLRFTLLQNLS